MNEARSPKRYVEGTHRVVVPAKTLARVQPLLALAGITRVANITGLDCIGVPVVNVIRANSRSVSVAQGKGLTLEAARVSGIMEALESYHSERVRAPLRSASVEEIAREGAVLDLASVPRVEGAILRDGVRCLWMTAHDALSGKTLWLPYELVHTDYTPPIAGATGAFLITDSGVASGNTPLEAVSHAVCELIERDAVTLWAYANASEQARHRVRVDSIEDPAGRSVLDRFAHAGLLTAVWDISSNAKVSAFHCTIVSRSPDPWRPTAPASGSGCHPCREIALLRALTEAAQARLTVIAGNRDDVGMTVYSQRRSVADIQQKCAKLMGQPERVSFAELPTFHGRTIEDDVGYLLESLVRIGVVQVAVVDLSLPEFQIPVVRVVIPGLEPLCDAAGYTPGARARRHAQ